MVARIVVLTAATILLGACGDADVEVCEEFIRDGLAAPSTYKRVSVTRVDEPATLKSIQENHGKVDTFDKIFIEGGRLAERQLLVEYDADNSFGVPLRGSQICEFHLIDGELPDRDMLESGMRMAKSTRNLRELARAGLLPDQPKLEIPEPKFACCEN